jgi:hypothetical protein
MYKVVQLCILISFTFGSERFGGEPGGFQKLGGSAEGKALGGVCISSLSNLAAQEWNPAGVYSVLENELSVSYTLPFLGASETTGSSLNGVHVFQAGFARRLKTPGHFVLGSSILLVFAEDIPAYDTSGKALQAQNTLQLMGRASASYYFMKYLILGMSIKYFYQNFTETARHGFSMDGGVISKVLPGLTAALTIKDFAAIGMQSRLVNRC